MNEFRRLIELQSTHRFPVVAHYGPGLPETEIKARAAQHAFDLAEEAISLYATVNGSTRDDQCPMHDLWVFPNYYMLDLDEALLTARYLLDNDPAWLPGWLPVFSSGGAAFVLCDERGRILKSSPESAEPSAVLGDEIRAFVSLLVQNFERGNIRKSSEGVMEWVSRPW